MSSDLASRTWAVIAGQHWRRHVHLSTGTLADFFSADALNLLASSKTGGHDALGLALGFFHSVAKRVEKPPYPCVLWDNERRRPLTHAQIAAEIGISEDSLEAKGRGVLAVLSAEKLLVVDSSDRDRFGRNFGSAFCLANGTLYSHLRRLKSNGRALGAKLKLLLEIQSAFDLDEGFAKMALEDLIQTTRLKRRTVIKLVKELIADDIIACIGPNRLSFRAEVFGADAFGAYDGPVFIAENRASKLGLAAVDSRSGDDEIRVGGSEIPVIYTDHSRPITTLRSESALRAASSTAQPSPAAAAQSSARAREAAAGNDVAHRVDVPNPRLGLESYQSLLKALMDGRGFDGLTDETYFTLASEAVRGRMMFALEQQRDEVIAVLKVWADKWAKLPYAHPSSLFLALWMRAEKQDPAKPIRSFRSFFEYAINDRLSEYSLPTAHHSMASGVESN